jgi:predicted transcriptional regulator
MRIDRESLFAALHPSRYAILLELGKEPSYSSKLENTLKINRKVAIFHLAVLQRYGLVQGEFGLKNTPEKRPVAVKYFHLTDKGKNVLSKIKAINPS